METENGKTKLQEIVEQLREKMTRAIVQAIEEGANYNAEKNGGLHIDGIYLTPKFGSEYRGLVLDIGAPEIDNLFEPSKEELEKMAQQKRAELEEIEKKINEYETDNDQRANHEMPKAI